MKMNINFMNNKKQKLRGVVHVPKGFDSRKNNAIIFLHGFPGSGHGSTAKRAGRDFCKRGYLVMRFDFSGTNKSDGKFENKFISQEVKEIKNAIDFLFENYSFKKLILVGHSTGGIDAALYGYRDKRVNRIVLFGCSGDLKESVKYEFTQVQIKQFWEKGFIRYKRIGKWFHNKRLKKRYYDEFFNLDVLKSLSRFKRKVLIVHGSEDEAVPAEVDARDLYKAARKSKLVIVKGADHRFTKKKHWNRFIKEVCEFS
jgi:uncharacterized protein